MPTAHEILRTVAAEVFTPREVLAVDEWADRYRILPRKVSTQHGRYSTDLTPYARRPMRCFTHPHVRHITLMWASQTSKTETIENMKGYVIDADPANALVMYGNLDEARNFNQDRFVESIRACPRLERHLLPSPQETKALKINFDSCIFYFVGSNSKSGRRGKPVQRLFLDEVGSYLDPEYVEVYERVKGGDGTYKIVDSSTPDDENTGIHAQFIAGSREEYFVPCPHCGGYQRLVFKGGRGGLVWDGGLEAGIDEAKATARYRCDLEGCGKDMHEWHKPEMLRAGVWVPMPDVSGQGGRSVEDVLEKGEGSAAGTGRGQRTGVERSHVSFHISSLYSPFGGASWGEVAAAFLLSVRTAGAVTKAFVRGWLGEPWREIGDGMGPAELRKLCVPRAEGGYGLGEVERGVLAIVRGIDVQKDCVWVVDRGFGERGRDTWLVNFLRIPRTVGMNLADVWPKLPAAYRRVGTKEMIRVQAEFIDSGFFTDEVYKGVLARRMAGVRAFAVKGKRRAGSMAAPWTLGVIDKLPDGTPIKGFPRLLVVNSDYWKQAVMGRVRGMIDEPQAELAEGEAPDEAPGFYLPEHGEIMQRYLEQVTSEHRIEERGRDGRKHPQWVWKLRPGRSQNHAFDAECYAMCGAEFLGVRRLKGREHMSK